MCTKRGVPPHTTAHRLRAGPGGPTGAEEEPKWVQGPGTPGTQQEETGRGHQGYALGKAREPAPDETRAPGDVGAPKPELWKLTQEGPWPPRLHRRRRAASKGREPREGAASQERAGPGGRGAEKGQPPPGTEKLLTGEQESNFCLRI